MGLLRKGRTLTSDVTGDRYRITSDLADEGGFGEIYRGRSLDAPAGGGAEDVAVKVTDDPWAWHGEAYFGRLLLGHPHVVTLHDAFPVADGAGARRQVKYVLIHDWMAGGTVHDHLTAGGGPWDEDDVVDQVAFLLHVLSLLHTRGIVHGDVTPRNVFIDDGKLVLGDLGITTQGLLQGPVPMEARAPAQFVPHDAPPMVWSPGQDVYQVGLIAASLLAGEQITSWEMCGKVLKGLPVSDEMKGWTRDAVVDAPDRFSDAGEALDAILARPVRPARAPRSLRGQRVVFTGRLSITRPQAQRRAAAAGATVQNRVNGATTLIVAGQPNPLQIGQAAGTKLFDAHRRIRRGQRIAIIDEARFHRLTER